MFGAWPHEVVTGGRDATSNSEAEMRVPARSRNRHLNFGRAPSKIVPGATSVVIREAGYRSNRNRDKSTNGGVVQ